MFPSETLENATGHKIRKPFISEKLSGDLGEDRTLDPLIKSQLLYRLSYQVIFLPGCKYAKYFHISNV